MGLGSSHARRPTSRNSGDIVHRPSAALGTCDSDAVDAKTMEGGKPCSSCD
jgi:hypothetical protein